MRTSTDSHPVPGTSYTPGPERDAILADALGCIISGRPLPESLRSAPVDVARPSCVEDGIRRMLDGPPRA